jgi:hypothetical protein
MLSAFLHDPTNQSHKKEFGEKNSNQQNSFQLGRERTLFENSASAARKI